MTPADRLVQEYDRFEPVARDALPDNSRGRSLVGLKAKTGRKIVEGKELLGWLFISAAKGRPNEVHVDWIERYPGTKPGEGVRILQPLFHLADKNGVTLTLVPAQRADKLIALYENACFRFVDGTVMRREPKSRC